MLRIAEYNTKTGKKIELKELEKFGFEYKSSYTPKVDENGHIVKYHKLKKDGTYTKKEYTEYEEVFGHYKYEIKYEYYRYYFFVQENRTIMFMADNACIDDDNIYDFDILYDLITNGYVEKVEE